MSKRARLIWGLRLAAVPLIVLLVAVGVEIFRTESLMNQFGPPPPTGQDCGSIVHSEMPPARTARADASIQTLTCFWNAYQSCQAATMSQTLAGVDAGSTKTITVEWRSGHCVIYGQVEYFANTEHSTAIFLCNHLSKAGATLQLSDCDNSEAFALVPRNITRNYSMCGVVGGGYSYYIPQQVEQCFFSAYQNCWDDAMQYDTHANVPPPTGELDFFIDNHCGIAYLHNSYTTIAPLATCASLEQRADGLHFRQCGTDGDIFVPSAPPGSAP